MYTIVHLLIEYHRKLNNSTKINKGTLLTAPLWSEQRHRYNVCIRLY